MIDILNNMTVAHERLSQIPEEEEAPAASAVSSVLADVSDRSDTSVVAPAQRRFSRIPLMGSRHAVQNAVVVATTLGPCRTVEPHDARQ